jgi:cytochrome c-type biogenesis protein
MINEVPSISIAFLAGILSFISPCVLPLVPAYIGYLSARAGQQVSGQLATAGAPDQPTTPINKGQIFLHGILFVLGFTLVFVFIGLSITTGLRLLGVDSYAIQSNLTQIGGIVVIFFGLHVMGVTGWIIRRISERTPPDSALGKFVQRIQGVLYADTRVQINQRAQKGYSGSVMMGIVFAAGWTPCVGPIYGSILTVAATSPSTSGILLTAYSLGLGVPFLIAAAGIDRVKPFLKRIQKRMKWVELASGLLLITMGWMLYTNQLATLAGRLTWLTDFAYNTEECVVGLAQGRVPGNEFGTCMSLGPNYKFKINPPQAGQ